MFVRRELLFALLLLASPAQAQNRQPASITVQPTVTPEPVQILDSAGHCDPDIDLFIAAKGAGLIRMELGLLKS